MRYRLLGQTGLRVSEIFLGAMGFGGEVRGPSAQDVRRIVGLYEEAGGNVIDTAITYGDGRSEAAVAAAVTGRRDRFVLATKYTLSRDVTDPNGAGNHRKNLTLSLETSLRRLGTNYIDVYWVHVWDRHTPIEETMRALDDAVRSGKVLYVGMSDAPAWLVSRANTLAEWRDWTPFAGIQVPYNLLNRDVERELLPMAEHLGLSVAAWSPLAHGLLASTRTTTPGDNAVLNELRTVADEVGATPAQVALTWLRSRSPRVHPIIGATTPAHLAENLAATGLELPPEALERLSAATAFDRGFPRDFIDNLPPWVFGDVQARLDPR